MVIVYIRVFNRGEIRAKDHALVEEFIYRRIWNKYFHMECKRGIMTKVMTSEE